MEVIILNKPAHQCFYDVAKVCESINSDESLCFGVQDWTFEELKSILNNIKGKSICYQLEVLDGKTYYSNSEYIKKLSFFDEVWDYSLHNFEFLKQNNITPIYKPVLPSSLLTEDNIEKDIDVLHFGALNLHRAEYLNFVIENNITVYDVQTDSGTDLWGIEIHRLIRRSKVVLGLHSFINHPIQEAVRYQYPLSNGIKILAEKSLSNPLKLEEFSSKEEMVFKLESILNTKGKEKSTLKTDKNVSIIMPVYNGAEFLSISINSVINQTYSNWELICVDDGSVDKSLEILNDFARLDKRIKVFSQQNQGPAQARSFAFEHAQGVYAIYLDADDWFESNLLEKCIEQFEVHDTDIVMPNLFVQNCDMTTFEDRFSKSCILYNSSMDNKEAFYRSLSWNGIHSIFMCKTSLFKLMACDKKHLYNNFNADEFITRNILLNTSHRIRFCASAYYYRFNEQSITKKFSIKILGYLETNYKLLELAKEHSQALSTLAFIQLNSLNEMTELLLKYFTNKYILSASEKKEAVSKFSYYYKLLEKKVISKILYQKGVTQKVQSLLLLRGFSLYFTTVYIYYHFMRIVKSNSVKYKNKIYPYIQPAEFKLIDAK